MENLLENFYGELAFLALSIIGGIVVAFRSWIDFVDNRRDQEINATEVLIAQYKEQNKRVNDLHTDNLQLVSLNARHAADMDHIMYDNDSLREKVSDALDRLEIANNEIGRLTNKIDQLEADAIELNRQVKTLEGKDAKINSLRASLNQSEIQRSALSEERIDFASKKAQFDAERSQYESIISSLKSRIKDLEESNNEHD